jgi:hypothetical protein
MSKNIIIVLVSVLNQLTTMQRRRMREWRYRPPSLTSTLDAGDWSASRTGQFTARDGTPVLHTEGWVGPRASLDAVEK